MENQQANENVSPPIIPYRCERTGEEGICLKYYFNPEDGFYNRCGKRVNCTECAHFFEP
jgi:hypothetical protein